MEKYTLSPGHSSEARDEAPFNEETESETHGPSAKRSRKGSADKEAEDKTHEESSELITTNVVHKHNCRVRVEGVLLSLEEG